MKKPKKLWAGFVDGKLYLSVESDTYGLRQGAVVFSTRGEAARRFEDVREVRVVEARKGRSKKR